jgi:hypothetical protein
MDRGRDEMHTDRHRAGWNTLHIYCTIELWVWPPMAGLHSTGDELLADSGGSGCATAWHRHLLQPKAGAIPFCCNLLGWDSGDG